MLKPGITFLHDSTIDKDSCIQHCTVESSGLLLDMVSVADALTYMCITSRTGTDSCAPKSSVKLNLPVKGDKLWFKVYDSSGQWSWLMNIWFCVMCHVYLLCSACSTAPVKSKWIIEQWPTITQYPHPPIRGLQPPQSSGQTRNNSYSFPHRSGCPVSACPLHCLSVITCNWSNPQDY